MAAMLADDAPSAIGATPAAVLVNEAIDAAESTVFVSRPVVQPVPEPAIVEDEEDHTFASLRDAVNGHRDADDLTAEERCMAVAVFYESKGEPLKGQLAVAQVILNRVDSQRFPGSVCGVVTQRSQFSFVRGGRLPSARPGQQWETAKAVARTAMADAWEGPVGQAMFFHATRVSPGWNRAKVATVGNHVFYR